MAEVCRDERRIESEGMRRNGGIKILNPRSTAFQGRFDAAEHPADGIGPLGAWEFREDEIDARLQRLRHVDRETSAAVDELLIAVTQARRSKEPRDL